MGKLEKIRVLKKKMDIQQLLDAASATLRNPIAMFDASYSLLAHTEVSTDDPIWVELVSTGTFSIETQRLFADVYFTFSVANSEKIVVLKSEQLKYDRVIATVINRDRIRVANLVMVACNVEFDADDLVAFSAFADKISAKIRDDAYFTEYGKSRLSSLIIGLLDNEITDTRVYTSHIRMLYDGFEQWMFLAVIKSAQDSTPEFNLEDIADALSEKYKSFKFAIYYGCIVMIMSSKRSDFNVRRVMRDYNELFERFDLFAGISGCFENLFQLRISYDEAMALLLDGLENKSTQRIYFN